MKTKKIILNVPQEKEQRLSFCECGCGQKVTKPGNRYINHHWMKNPVNAANHSAALSGVPKSIAHKAADSVSTKKRWKDVEYRENHLVALKNLERRKAASKRMLGDKNIMNLPGVRERHLKAVFKGLKLRPTKPEKLLDKLLQRLFPNQWKYVGDGSFIVGYRNPDFVNVNGQKKIIEMFGDYWHSKKVTGIFNEQHEQERIDRFAKYGYQTLIIWQHELENIDSIVDKIQEFHNKKF